EEIVPCAEQTCRQCGAATAVIGYDESEQVDVQPARYFARKAGLPLLPGRRRDHAPIGSAHRGKGIGQRPRGGGDGGRQYADHLPLYRQAAILEREAGLEIGQATLDGWVMRVGDMLQPVVSGMRQDLLGGSYLQADETIVPVQMHDKRGADHQAYLWQYGKPGGETGFDFCMGRGREGPQEFMGQVEGVLQTDV